MVYLTQHLQIVNPSLWEPVPTIALNPLTLSKQGILEIKGTHWNIYIDTYFTYVVLALLCVT